jgi:transcriptional regulator GlxA family with amidase domain
MPPAHLFRRHRLRAARAYLLSAQASVAEVAATFGFPSASHFSRVYRGEFARSPVEDLRQMLA